MRSDPVWIAEDIPVPSWARAAARFYRVGAGVSSWLYDRGWRRVRRLPVPVVSVGNLVVGGTGKTPVVRELAEAAMRAGLRPAILTRGYGGRADGLVLRNGRQDGKQVSPEESGDEPLLLSRMLPTVPVAVDKNRFRAASALLGSGEKVDMFLLDDGFQHRALARDRDIVLVDASRPFGNGRCLPAGPLRERPKALRRAHRLLVTGAEDEGVPQATQEALQAMAPGVPQWACRFRWDGLRRLPGWRQERPAPGTRVYAVPGIARPERFRRSLEEGGLTVAGWSEYPDHHPFSEAEIRREEEAARMAEAFPVTTAKDAIRIESRVTRAQPWLVADVRMEIEGGWDAFLTGLFLFYRQ